MDNTPIKVELKGILLSFILILIFILLGGFILSLFQGMSALDAMLHTLSLVVNTQTHGAAGVLPLIIIFGVVSATYYIIKRFVKLVVEEGLLGEVFRMTKLVHLKNHYLICGAGRVGLHVANQLNEAGIKFVIMDTNDEAINECRNRGWTAIKGDCLEEHNLRKAGVYTAKGLIAVLGRTEDNLYLVMQAKELNKDAVIYARAHDEKMLNRLKQVGAQHVIMPEIVGANEIVSLITAK